MTPAARPVAAPPSTPTTPTTPTTPSTPTTAGSRARHLALVPALPAHVVGHPVVYRTVPAAGLPHPSQLPPLSDDLPRLAAVDVPSALRRALLDPRWRRVPPGADVDVVVAALPDEEALRAVRLRCPGALVLAVLPADAATADTVALLGAGVDGCIRGSDPREVVAHVAALVRRSARARRPQAAG